jgi:hypothetical protein
MPPKPNPVWLLFRRRTFSRLAYGLQVLGYNLRDHSVSNRFYFVYFCAFWLAWAVAVFAMLGSALANSIELIPETSPSALAVNLGIFILAIWGFIELWRVTGRSPFVFSESDAYLLCQTPVRRRTIGFAWFLMDWFGTILPFAAGTVLFSFTLTEITLTDTATLQSLSNYFTSSFRSLAIILPLQMGLQAGSYGLGALRLRRNRSPEKSTWLRLIPLLSGLGLLTAIFLPDLRSIILAPLIIPLQAAFGSGSLPTNWLVGAGLTFLILLVGITLLLVWTDRMQLSWAAQETRLVSAIRSARSVMNNELVENIQRQSKMTATRHPSQLPVRNGLWMVIWKNLVQSSRSLRARQAMRWVFIFFLMMSTFISSGWIVQLIMGGFWAVSLGSLATDRLRNDLARWWLLRSLPFQNSRLVLSLLGPSWVAGVLLGWLALALTNPPFGWMTAALLPFLAACAALGSAHNILEHAKTRILMTPGVAEENVPRQNVQGAIIILIAVGIPLGLLTWSSSHSGGYILGLLSLSVAVVITYLLFESVTRAYRWIK